MRQPAEQLAATLLDDYESERVEATQRIIADTDTQTKAWMANTRRRIIGPLYYHAAIHRENLSGYVIGSR